MNEVIPLTNKTLTEKQQEILQEQTKQRKRGLDAWL